jgi:hypothetical protein
MTFAYSHRPLLDLIEKKFLGDWKYLEKAIFEISEEKANLAITELAVFLRILDDEDKITAYHKQIGNIPSCGRLILEDGEEKELSFREFSNKVIHSKTFEWTFSEGESPKLICYARDDEARKWNRAVVELVYLAAICGQLMS